MTASSSIGTSAIEQTTTFRDGNAKGERQLSRREADANGLIDQCPTTLKVDRRSPSPQTC